jgi:prevent-host-death family protein
MTKVTIRELRNHGGDVVDRVIKGETLIVTRDGHPVIELRPLRRPAQTATTLLERWRTLPAVDAALLLANIDEVLDAKL